MIIRVLKDLDSALPLTLAGGPRVEGYAMKGGKSWLVPGTTRSIVHLHELYALHNAAHSGRVTVPVLWDSVEQCILSNDSGEIMRFLDSIPAQSPVHDFTLSPIALRHEIDDLNQTIHTGLNNAVYQAGFAAAQTAYDTAIGDVFETLEALEQRLAVGRFLFGDVITDSDWRLFPTLIRFDTIYAVLFKCCLRRLVDYPNLWNYTRDLFTWRNIAETVDFDTMRIQSYLNDQATVHPIVAVAPHIDWHEAHYREPFGQARVYTLKGNIAEFNPLTLQTR